MLLLRWSYSSQPQPFVQSDWPLTGRPQLSAIDATAALPLSLYQPFEQADWPSLARPPLSLKSDVYGTLNALLTPNPAQPFEQTDWPRPADPKKAIGEAVGTLNALLTPNPAQPFVESDWPSLASAQARTIDASIAASLALYVPGVPFSQSDWPSPYSYTLTYSDRGNAFGLSPNFAPAPPPVFLTKLFTVSGPSVIDLFPAVGVAYHTLNPTLPIERASRRTATGTSTGPSDGLVAEDGVTFLVAEDGTTFLVKE